MIRPMAVARLVASRFARVPLTVLPLAALLVVAAATVWAARTPFSWSLRAYSGPTEGQRRISLRLELRRWPHPARRDESNPPVSLSARDRLGRRAEWSGGSLLGEANAVLDFGAPAEGPIELRAEVAGQRAAEGELWLSQREWRAAQSSIGGWLRGSIEGELTVDVALARGVLAIPFADRLLVRVTRDGVPVQAAVMLRGDGVTLRGEGLESVEGECSASSMLSNLLEGESRAPNVEGGTSREPGGASSATTPGSASARWRRAPSSKQPGRFSLWSTATELAVSLSVCARSGDDWGYWHGRLPVIAGASRATLSGTNLLFQSPIARERLYYSIVNQKQRWGGGSVVLESNSRGGSEGRAPWNAPQSVPWWVVVSSEPGLTSGSTLGWPVVFGSTAAVASAPSEASLQRLSSGEPLSTLTVREPLVLDGTALLEADAKGRRRRAAIWAGLSVLLTLVFTLGIATKRVRDAQAYLQAHLVAHSGATDVQSAKFARAVVDSVGLPRALLLLTASMVLGYVGMALWLFEVYR